MSSYSNLFGVQVVQNYPVGDYSFSVIIKIMFIGKGSKNVWNMFICVCYFQSVIDSSYICFLRVTFNAIFIKEYNKYTDIIYMSKSNFNMINHLIYRIT